MINVVHIHQAGPDAIYIGRPMRERPGSQLGNPFRVEEYGRDTAIKCYHQYLGLLVKAYYEGRRTEPVLRTMENLLDIAYLSLQGDVELACWCAPLPCHGDIIIRAVNFILSH